MVKFFKVVKFSNVADVKALLEDIGYDVRVFPLSERGVNQSNFRKLEISFNGSLAENLKIQKKLRDSNIEWSKL